MYVAFAYRRVGQAMKLREFGLVIDMEVKLAFRSYVVIVVEIARSDFFLNV